jgi:hypothetical protein
MRNSAFFYFYDKKSLLFLIKEYPGELVVYLKFSEEFHFSDPIMDIPEKKYYTFGHFYSLIFGDHNDKNFTNIKCI